MIEIEWTDREGRQQKVRADSIRLWEAFGGGREHPDGTVIEAYRDGSGILQLDVDDRRGLVYIREVQ